MTEFINKDTGEETEGFTQEELDQKLEEERTKADEEKNVEIEQLQKDREEETRNLEEQLEEKDKEMEKVGSKDYNWKKLRDQKVALEETLAKERKTTDEKIDGIKKEITGGKVDKAIEKVTDDTELAKKVKFHYGTFTGEPKDDKEFQERIKNASLLAGVGGVGSSPLSGGAIGSGSGLPPQPKSSGGEGKLSPEAKAMAKKDLGFTDEEIKQHNL